MDLDAIRETYADESAMRGRLPSEIRDDVFDLCTEVEAATAQAAGLEKVLRRKAVMEHDPRHHGGAPSFETCAIGMCRENAAALAPEAGEP